jgi:hypothetical protein
MKINNSRNIYLHLILAIILCGIFWQAHAQQVEFSYKKGEIVKINLNDGSIIICEWVSQNDTAIVCFHLVLGQITIYKSAIVSDQLYVSRNQVKVYLKDSKIISGNILSNDKEKLRIQSDTTGIINLNQKDIQKIQYLRKDGIYGKAEYDNLEGRYYFAPSAICMKKGEGYYQNTLGLLQSINYAFTDYFTLGFSTELITLAMLNPIVIVTPKVGIEILPNFHIGAGWFHASLFIKEDDFERSSFNIGYATFTYGNNDKNITFNVGKSSAGVDASTYALCGFYRLSKKVGFIYENWFLPVKDWYYYGDNDVHYTPIISTGVRLIGKRSMFDIGLVTNPIIVSDLDIFGLPIVSYTVKF